MASAANAPTDHTSAHQRIVSSLLSVTGFIILAKIAAALKEAVVAARYGISAPMDAYIYLFNSLNWPVGAWLGILTSVIIPAVMRARLEDPNSIRAFRREFFGFTIVAATTVTCIAAIVLTVVLGRNLPGFSSAALAIADRVAGPLLLVVPLGFVTALLSVHLMTQHRHINNLLEGVPALSILVAAMAFPVNGAWPLLWGTIAGFAIQAVLLALCQTQSDPLGLPRFAFNSPIWNTVSMGLTIVIGGQLLQTVSDIVDQNMVAHLGVGANSTLGYAARLLSIALTLASTALTRTLLPIISQIQSTDAPLARAVTIHWAGLSMALGMAAIVAGWFVSPLAVKLVYERGAFTAADTVATANVIRAGLFQIPFFMTGIVFLQLIASRGKYLVFLYVGCINFPVKILANLFFVKQMGIPGVMIGTAVMYAVSMSVLFYFCMRATSSPALSETQT